MNEPKPHPSSVSVTFLTVAGDALEKMYGPRLCGAEFADFMQALGDAERAYCRLPKEEILALGEVQPEVVFMLDAITAEVVKERIRKGGETGKEPKRRLI